MNRLITLVLALTLAIGAASGVTTLVVTQDAQARSIETAAAEQRLSEATRSLGAERTAWEAQREDADETVAAAQDVLAASEGRVLDETPRTALSDVISDAKRKLAQADARIGMVDRAYRDVYWAEAERDAASIQAVVSYIGEIELPDVAVDLDAEVQAVENAVTAWEAEQARIAAEAERARQAEQAQNAPKNTGTGAAPSGPSESSQARVERLMRVLGISIPFVIQETSCGGKSNVLGCYNNGGVIILTPYLMTKSDSAECKTISHEYRHYIQVRDMLGYDRATNSWDTGWMEADAKAHERGC
jgi:hypothetical protein